MRYETPQHRQAGSRRLDADALGALNAYIEKNRVDAASGEMCVCEPAAELCAYVAKRKLPFSQLLMDFIRKSGVDEVEVYKRAYVDRKLFSKIRSNAEYQPRKTTVVAFALALRLSLEETRSLLASAGYALSDSSLFDLIIRFFVERGEYDFFLINDALYEFDQPVLAM